MAGMTEPRELFLHELRDLLYAENLLVKTLPKLAEEVQDPNLHNGLVRHLDETKGQVANLERAFAMLGEEARGEGCSGMEGLIAEHDRFVQEHRPTGMICDMFVSGAGAKAEHYEIAAYTGLIESARTMGERDVARLLEENLAQEKGALKEMEAVNRRLVTESSSAERAPR